jgi:hypothetical protein
MEYQLLEDFLNGQATDIERHRIELIRVLSRSGTSTQGCRPASAVHPQPTRNVPNGSG